MRRSVPKEAPEWQAPTETRERIEVRLCLITPMFGGGYRTREVDEVVPIRAAAIRGHLRFWWRATAGARYGDPQSLYEAECALWGGAATPDNPAVGKVAVQVKIHNLGTGAPYQSVAPQATRREGPQHGYFLFPFQALGGQGVPAAMGRRDVEFSVTLSWASGFLSEEQKREIESALKAWVAFGGVGARTRRGCGALKAVDSDAARWLPPPNNPQEWFRNLLPRDLPHDQSEWTTLKGAQILLGQLRTSDPFEVWRALGKFWAQFRKGHFNNYVPTGKGGWRDYQQLIERELIKRKLIKRTRSRGKEQITLAKPFLGLPIIYQRLRGVQFSGTLEPADLGRMASPVILKPLALANGQVAPLVAVLNAPAPDYISINGHKVSLVSPNPQQEPLLKKLGANSVLDAVIKAAQPFVGANPFTL